MDLNEIKLNAENLKKKLNSLDTTMKSILVNLKNINNIILKQDIDLNSSLSTLIKKYNSFHEEIIKPYLNSINIIIQYTNNSNQNFEDLITNLNSLNKEIYDITYIINNIN